MLTLPATARAEPPASEGPLPESEQDSITKHKRASEFYESALASYERGNMALAIIDFRHSYELDGDFHVQYNIGLCARRLGHDAAAARAFEKYLKEGGSSISTARFDEVEGYLSSLHGSTASLVLTVNEPGAEVFLDGTKIGTAPMRDLRVDTGLHSVSVTKPGFESVTRTLSFVSGREEVMKVQLAPKNVPSNPGQSALPLWISWGVTGASLATTIGLSLASSAMKVTKRFPDEITEEQFDEYDRAQASNYRAETFAKAAAIAGGVTIVASVVSIALTTAHIVNRVSDEKSAMAKGVWFDGTAMRGRF